jgi:mono/diheme cytochrome c family protein
MRSLSPKALLLCVCAVVTACSADAQPLRPWRPEDHAQPVGADPREPPPEAPAEQGGVSRAAEALFNVSCGGCHGRDGRGGGVGLPPGVQLPDFSSAEFQKSRTDAAIAQVITEGRGMMPPFAKQVNPQGIVALVAHVRRLAVSPP